MTLTTDPTPPALPTAAPTTVDPSAPPPSADDAAREAGAVEARATGSTQGVRPGWGRLVGAAAAATLTVGVATALVARVLMRVVTQVVGGEPGFTFVGTLGIAIVFTAFMVPAALGGALEARSRRALVGVLGTLTTSVVLGWGTALTALTDLADHPLREGRETDLVAALLVAFGATVVVGAAAARGTPPGVDARARRAGLIRSLTGGQRTVARAAVAFAPALAVTRVVASRYPPT